MLSTFIFILALQTGFRGFIVCFIVFTEKNPEERNRKAELSSGREQPTTRTVKCSVQPEQSLLVSIESPKTEILEASERTLFILDSSAYPPILIN